MDLFVRVPIQLSHERRQVFRHRGASGVGEFGPQSGRKRLQEPHRVEGDGEQMAHPNAPTDLPWPNRSVARLMSAIRQKRHAKFNLMSVRVPWNAGVTQTDNEPVSLSISEHEGLVGNPAVASNSLQCIA